MADPSKKSEFHAYDRGASFMAAQKAAPPPRHAANAGDKPVAKPGVPATEEKLTDLRAFRRAWGLCDICAEKWFRGHKCAATIPLQAMQEVWNLFQTEDLSDRTDVEQDTLVASPEQLFLALSSDALRGSRGR